MSRPAIYPWELLTEVGDYFCVPLEFKDFNYMSRLTSQKNWREKGVRFVCQKTSYGSIVMLADIEGEVPAHEFTSPEGILSSTSRSNLLRTRNVDVPRGDRPALPKRTQEQIVNAMSMAEKQRNLPWWVDPKTGAIASNSKIITPGDLDKWYKRELNFKPNDPYPEYYHLDENLQRREPEEEEVEMEPDDEDLIGEDDRTTEEWERLRNETE